MYGDNMKFDTAALGAQIGVMQEIRDTISTLKTNYVDYINESLKPNWTTDAGVKSTDELINFAEVDIQSFIIYLDNRIADLEAAKERTALINEA